MYFKALLEGLSDMPNADAGIREQIEKEATENGWAYIHQQLAKVDLVSAERINPNDPQRLQRALEVYRLTGISMTEMRLQQQQTVYELPYNLLQIAVAPDDRAILHQRIETRFNQIMDRTVSVIATILKQKKYALSKGMDVEALHYFTKIPKFTLSNLMGTYNCRMSFFCKRI